jgi:hypothetical protein
MRDCFTAFHVPHFWLPSAARQTNYEILMQRRHSTQWYHYAVSADVYSIRNLNVQCSETDRNYQPNRGISERYGCDQTKLRPRSDHLLNAFFCRLTDLIEPIVVSKYTQQKKLMSWSPFAEALEEWKATPFLKERRGYILDIGTVRKLLCDFL